MTVAERFHKLLASIAVTRREADGYAVHQYGVRQALADEFPGAVCETVGSHARGSAIGGTSDLDLLARLPIGALRRSSSSNELVSSNTALGNVRQRLLARYPSTSIGRDGQAVVVSFAGGARDIDVVPAVWAGMIDVPFLGAKRSAFYIPDGAGGWMQTAPQAHNEYIASANVRSAHKLRFVAQLLRHWRRCRAPSVPMLTFHAELVLAQEGTCAAVTSYSRLMADAFNVLARREGRALQDPLSISGYIQIASTPPKRSEVAKALAYAAEHAAKAVMLEGAGRLSDAYGQWSLVFNGQFPSR